MSERPVSISDDISARQTLAADPARSVWVTANAGSGKTHVLTQRVLRLLLSGVRPEAMLCLTYTKAAAAEMRARVSKHLADWATLPEAELFDTLQKLETKAPSPEKLAWARTLFAQALDSPGGLKINTIHAFCESVLHRFPLEAGVPLGFSVIEEAEQKTLVQRATEGVLAEGLNGSPEVAKSVATLFARLSDDQIEKAIGSALSQGTELRQVLLAGDAAIKNLHALTGFDPARDLAFLEREVVAGSLFGPSEAEALFVITPPNPDKKRFEDKIARLDLSALNFSALFGAFLTAKNVAPARSNAKKDVQSADPALAELIDRETERLEALAAEIRMVELVERSEALLGVLGAIVGRYEREKRVTSRLDFDDLVERLIALLEDETQRQWVMYKLDSGITHVLVDESQDTNPEQWTVVREIADDFFSGEGARLDNRTVFAVGDRKQSIYSFQGAEPRLFGETGDDFNRRAVAARQPFEKVALKASFRTLPGILSAVDKVTMRADIRAGLLIEDASDGHDSARSDPGGRVTIWPIVSEAEKEALPEEWPTDIRDAGKSAPRRLAEQVAGQIAEWVSTNRPLEQRGRAVRAEDVLVLVQSRGPLFHEIIRAVKLMGLATPGADRLTVTSHIAVLDLLALGDVLLHPADDLQLAALLRSPLFGLTEEQLYAVSADRANGQTLWRALRECPEDWAQTAFEQLSTWRGRLDFERPFEFFAHVLYAEGGLRRFHARLGTEVDDVLAEFLDLALAQEREKQPSLQGFLGEMRRRDVSIKRELSESGGGVRVMTVHGAKGLEAPIVILADAASKTAPQKLGKPVYVEAEAPGPVLVHAGSVDAHVPETRTIRDADVTRQEEEYWRKLYVGMTRAEDELYVAGFLTERGKADGTWYEAILDALGEESEIVPAKSLDGDVLVYPKDRPTPKPLEVEKTDLIQSLAPLVLPPIPTGQALEVITPSRADAHKSWLGHAADIVRDAEAARKFGIALHALLQHLPSVPEDLRERVAKKAAAALMTEAPGEQKTLAAKALSIVSGTAHAELFAATSRAELGFSVYVDKDGDKKILNGRIDRLVMREDSVLIVDFKSDQHVPHTVEDVPAAYLTQLSLYALAGKKLFAPKRIEAAIFWTENETLMELPADVLETKSARFTIG